jgi:hypothetical protein
MSNKLFLWCFSFWAVTLSVMGLVVYHRGFSEGQTDTAEKVFRYCHDQGGFLRNQNTGELVGCGRVTQGEGA